MYKVAIIGAGIGAHHLDGYLANSDRFDVAYICDLDAARGKPLAERGGAIYTDDFHTLLASDVDVVDICLPPHLHLPFAIKALDNGKHVVCEKPMVASLSEADMLEAAAERNQKHVFPIFQYRFGKGTAQFRALADAGKLGKPFVGTLETHWNRNAAYYAVDWRGTWATESGGAILGHAIHIHDLLCGLLGPVAEVHAYLDTRVNDIEVEDCAAIGIRMESGALVTSSVTLGAAEDMSRLRLVFENATIESDHAPYQPAATDWKFLARRPEEQSGFDAITTTVGEQAIGFAGYFLAVADALDGLPNAAVTLPDGRRSLEFVAAVYHSARTGEAVKLPLEQGHALYESWIPD